MPRPVQSANKHGDILQSVSPKRTYHSLLQYYSFAALANLGYMSVIIIIIIIITHTLSPILASPIPVPLIHLLTTRNHMMITQNHKSHNWHSEQT